MFPAGPRPSPGGPRPIVTLNLGDDARATEIIEDAGGGASTAGTGVASILIPFMSLLRRRRPGPAAADGAAADSARLQATPIKKQLRKPRRQIIQAMRVTHGVSSEGNRRLL